MTSDNHHGGKIYPPSPNPWLYISLIVFILLWGAVMLLLTFHFAGD
jgi:hypothetical protein